MPFLGIPGLRGYALESGTIGWGNLRSTEYELLSHHCWVYHAGLRSAWSKLGTADLGALVGRLASSDLSTTQAIKVQ